MRKHQLVAALMGSLVIVPGTVSAKLGPVRQVQLISMGAHAGEEPTSSPAAVSPPLTPLPETFRVHDLSRRYVEYRMAQEMAAAEPLAAASAVPALAYSPVMVAATSSIAVPGWMKGDYPAMASVAYTPGCAPLAYRPSGFLRPDAEARRATYYGMMSAIACEQGIPTGLFDAMIIRESRYNPRALSPKSAFGFAQLMPGTANDLGVNRYDPAQNLRGGARYLRQQLDKFGQVHLALAAYNAGPGRIRDGKVPRIAETQAYVANILGNWSRLNGSPAAATPVMGRQNRSVGIASF